MALSPEVLKKIEILSQIFMPYASARKQKFVIEGNGRFVHYTSAAAGLSIIRSKSIWMRNTTCMADYSEVQHGFAKLKAEENLKSLVRWLDENLSGSGTQATTLFDQWWNDTQYGTFISSISEHDTDEDTHGRLSMWRAFGGRSAARVAFVLNIPSNSTAGQLLNIFISPVAYFRGDQLSAEIGSVIGNASKNLDLLKSTERQHLIGSIFGTLVAGTVCLKHEGFHEEREWRVVYNPKRMLSPLMTSNIETIDGIPQIVYKIPISGGPPSELDEISIGNMLDRILIGPSPYPWAMYEAFATALSDAGVADPGSKVFVSGIPLRA
jgi:hypothetical protein